MYEMYTNRATVYKIILVINNHCLLQLCNIKREYQKLLNNNCNNSGVIRNKIYKISRRDKVHKLII